MQTDAAPRGSRRRSKPVDCEKCSSFTGRNGWARIEWGCAKGHAAESTVTLKRYEGCTTYHEASRDELIFRRFKASATLRGNADLKNRQTQAQRTANGLAKALQEFGDLLDSDQVQAGREAVAALNRLAEDIARASALAAAFKAREDEARELERRRKGDALADQIMSGWSEDQVVQCALDLRLFDTAEARKWLQERGGGRTMVDSGIWSPGGLAQRWQHAQGQARKDLYAELRRDLAQALECLDRPFSREYATRADFEAYRQLLRDQKAAKASLAGVVAVAMSGAKRPSDST